MSPVPQFASVVHSLGHSGLTPSHLLVAQTGLPGSLSGRMVQVPTLPAVLQALQEPTQAVSQQTPSAQSAPAAQPFPAVHFAQVGALDVGERFVFRRAQQFLQLGIDALAVHQRLQLRFSGGARVVAGNGSGTSVGKPD